MRRACTVAIVLAALGSSESAARPRLTDPRATRAPLGAQQAVARHGGTAQARNRFKRGVRAFAAQRYGEALDHFSASRQLRETATLVFNIAACQRELGRNADALASYSRFLELRGNRANDRDRTEVAAARLSLIAKVVTITLRTSVADARVLVNGQPSPDELLADPGTEVVLEAASPGYLDARLVLRPEAPGPLAVELRLEPVEVQPRTVLRDPEPTVQSRSPMRPLQSVAPERKVSRGGGMPPWVWIALGAAVVGVGTGVGAAAALRHEPNLVITEP